MVTNRRTELKLIPYIGCKAGFAEIFDKIIPDDAGHIYDIFGGGGGFTFYACNRFGSKKVTYNDHNPTMVNLMRAMKDDPEELYAEYQGHEEKSNAKYYLSVRKEDLDDGTRGAGRFFYLAKNAFSGKIRFNSSNKFNTPMRKSPRCPKVDRDELLKLSELIQDLEITGEGFEHYAGKRGGLVYLDPPYMNNTNSHYNATIPPADFAAFVSKIRKHSKVVISEQNNLESIGIPGFNQRLVRLQRSLQYFTQRDSTEVIAFNYEVEGLPG